MSECMYKQGLDYGAIVALTFSVCMCTCNYSAHVLVCGVFVRPNMKHLLLQDQNCSISTLAGTVAPDPSL